MGGELKKKTTISIHGASYLIAFYFNFHYKPTPFQLFYDSPFTAKRRDIKNLSMFQLPSPKK